MVVASLIGAGLAAVGWHAPFIAAAEGGPAATRKTHRVVILVDSDDEKVMRHALSYAINLNRYYTGMGQPVAVEIVANGAGLRLFRTDTSPLQEPLIALRNTLPNVTYSVCNSSKQIAEAREGHAMPLLPGARLVPFGIGRVIDLQEAGWTYVHA